MRYLGGGVIDVSKIHALGRTNRNTSRVLTLFQSVCTKCTFINISIRVLVPGIIWARSNAGSTTDAFISRYQNNTSVSLMTGTSRAAADARSIITLVTSRLVYYTGSTKVERNCILTQQCYHRNVLCYNGNMLYYQRYHSYMLCYHTNTVCYHRNIQCYHRNVQPFLFTKQCAYKWRAQAA